MSNSLQSRGLELTRLLCPWDFPGKNSGIDCHFLLQRIFLTQELNPCLLHCRQILYQLSYEGSPYICMYMCLCIYAAAAKSLQSCLTLCDPMVCSPPGSSVHVDSPGKNTGVRCHAFLQGIFPTQGSNLGLLHCRQILYQLSYQGTHPIPFGNHEFVSCICESISVL